MRKARITAHQIIAVIRSVESGRTVKDVYREAGISEATRDNWRVWIRRQGYAWNHKRLHRIYCLLKLNFRRKGKQRLPVRNPSPLVTPEALNQSWSVGVVFARSMLLMTVIVKRCRLKSI